MWSLADLKLYCLNITAFTVSLADISSILRIALLLLAIGYTVYKWKKDSNND
jgi:hypothetical protein